MSIGTESAPELVDYDLKNQGTLRGRLTLSDGSVLEIWVQVGNILRSSGPRSTKCRTRC
jgi:hypothetical protein